MCYEACACLIALRRRRFSSLRTKSLAERPPLLFRRRRRDRLASPSLACAPSSPKATQGGLERRGAKRRRSLRLRRKRRDALFLVERFGASLLFRRRRTLSPCTEGAQALLSCVSPKVTSKEMRRDVHRISLFAERSGERRRARRKKAQEGASLRRRRTLRFSRDSKRVSRDMRYTLLGVASSASNSYTEG